MEGKSHIETVKIDIDSSVKGNTEHALQDGEKGLLLEDSIEVDSWVNKVLCLHKSRKHKDRKTSDDVSIYRVPQSIKTTKPEAYDPLVVFLGPYHHKKHQDVTAMDEYKLQAVDKTLERLNNMNIEKLVAEVNDLDKDIRDCYEDSAIEWDEKTLALMMTMDACFILEFLRIESPCSSCLFFDVLRFYHIKRREVLLDILKLENQIPLCVLKKILVLEEEERNDAAAQEFLAKKLHDHQYFTGYPFSDSRCKSESLIEKLNDGGARHLLDLSRRVIADFLSNAYSGSGSKSGTSASYGTPNGSDSDASASYGTPNGSDLEISASNGSESAASDFSDSRKDESLIPSAEMLRKAGIHFKASTAGNFQFKRRCFRRGMFFIPEITVDDNTEIFLRNLVAFEECQLNHGSQIRREISQHMCIMDKLIDSKEDVKLFQRAKIIKNYLGSEDEVAKIFNDLCIGVADDNDTDYKRMLEMVNKHHKNPLNRRISEFWETYCSKPWSFVSVVAATLLLVLTLLQTIYSVKSYIHST